MLRLKPQSLGQYAPQPYGVQPVAPYHPIDTTTYYALRAAGAALQAAGDPGAPETMELVRRNIEAQGFPWEWATAGVTSGTPGKVSNLNSTLGLVATMRENPIISTIGILLIPVLAYQLGKKSARR